MSGNTIGEAFVKVRPDTDDFEKETDGQITRLGQTGARVGRAAGAAITATAAAATVWGTSAVFAASDQEEALSKVGAVFGESAGAVTSFAEDANNTLLISEQQALNAAGTYGNLLTSFGLTGEAAAGMSQDMVLLAQDLASFNNISVDEALDKLAAGLTGETEPLKALGAAFTATELQAKGLELGLLDQDGVLDQAGKAQASYALIMEKTTNAQGDAQRTAGGLANQMRTLQGDIQDMLADVGAELTPFATELIGVFKEAFGVIGPLLGEIAATLGPILTQIVEQLGPVISVLIEGLKPAFEAIGELVVNLPWDALTDALGIVLEAVASLLPPLVEVFSPILATIAEILPPLAELLAALATAFLDLLMPVLEALMPLFDALVAVFVDEIMPIILDELIPLITDLAAEFGDVLAQAIIELTPVLVELLQAIVPILPPLIELLELILPPLIGLFGDLVPPITDVVTAAVDLVTEFVESVFPMFETLGTWLGDVAGFFVSLWEDTISPFVDDIGEMVTDVLAFFGDLKDGISDIVDDIVGFFTGIASSIGGAFTGAVDGIKDAWNSGPGGFGFTVPGWVPGLGGKEFKIPELYMGGIAGAATIAQIGDRPGGEAVLTAPDVRELIAWSGADAGASTRSSRAGITFEGPVTFGSDMATATDELSWLALYRLDTVA